VQFGGAAMEDPNLRLSAFLKEAYNILKLNGGSNDVIQLRLCPFSLKD